MRGRSIRFSYLRSSGALAAPTTSPVDRSRGVKTSVFRTGAILTTLLAIGKRVMEAPDRKLAAVELPLRIAKSPPLTPSGHFIW
jgi:hypothetical protein